MSCRRSHEIDLPGFLEGAGGKAFLAFREHYPRCADCSAEVRAWTDLQHKLRGPDVGHPDADVLLRFTESRETLGSEQRAQVEHHIANCAACRDELETLKRFDFAALSDPAPEIETAPWWSGLTGWLRGVLWHPGFAYALVLILAIPLVSENWQPTHIGSLVAAESSPATQSLADPLGEISVAEPKPKRRAERRDFEAPKKPDSAAKLLVGAARSAANAPTERRDQLRAKGYVDAAAYQEESRADFAASAPPQAPTPALAMAERDQAEAPHAALNRNFARARQMVAAPLLEAHAPMISTRIKGDLLELRLPNPTGVEPGDELTVRIFRGDGSRELSERLAAGANGFTLLEIPAGWIGSGQHRVEIRISKDPPGAHRTLEYPFTSP